MRVIDVNHRFPSGRRVAVVAAVVASDVARVLAGGNGPVVARETGAGHLRVIDSRGWLERAR